MHIAPPPPCPLRAGSENTTVGPLIAKNATQALGSRCSALLLMSQRVHFDIYVKPADANESQLRSKNESTFAANQVPAKAGERAFSAKSLSKWAS